MVVRGRGQLDRSGGVLVPTRGRILVGGDIAAQAAKWAERGACEPSVVASLRRVTAKPAATTAVALVASAVESGRGGGDDDGGGGGGGLGVSANDEQPESVRHVLAGRIFLLFGATAAMAPTIPLLRCATASTIPLLGFAHAFLLYSAEYCWLV